MKVRCEIVSHCLYKLLYRKKYLVTKLKAVLQRFINSLLGFAPYIDSLLMLNRTIFSSIVLHINTLTF